MRTWIWCSVMAFWVVGAPVFSVEVPFEPARWSVDAEDHRFEEYLGQRALRLDRGMATVDGAVFRDGVIEFDLALSDQRGFSGVLWRVVDAENHEEFYLRHHLSGQPDASQYTPVFNGLRGWQLYTGPHFAGPVEFPANTWIHVKLVIRQNQADVYVDSDEPVLHIPELLRATEAGTLGFKSSLSPAWFANLSYRSLQGTEIVGRPAEVEPPPEGMVKKWWVSEPFPKGVVEGVFSVESDASGHAWKELEAEASGLANIARVARKTDSNDTVFVRLRLHAAEDQRRELRFGFSDEVRVFLNGELLFFGSDGFQSRDHKFLGSVGLFDAVVLPLKAGDNELWFAVSEVFGGWGVMAQLAERPGLRILPP